MRFPLVLAIDEVCPEALWDEATTELAAVQEAPDGLGDETWRGAGIEKRCEANANRRVQR